MQYSMLGPYLEHPKAWENTTDKVPTSTNPLVSISIPFVYSEFVLEIEKSM